MKLQVNTCYSHILYIQCAGELFSQAVHKLEMSAPNFAHEGVAGYIQVDVIFHIKDLTIFSRLWDSWYTLPEKRRIELYGLAKGLGDCK